MILFLCIYLIIGLIIARVSILLSGRDTCSDATEHLNKYDAFTVTIITYSGMMLSWPIVLIAAKLSNKEDKK